MQTWEYRGRDTTAVVAAAVLLLLWFYNDDFRTTPDGVRSGIISMGWSQVYILVGG